MYYRGAAAAILVFDITREVCPLLLLRSFCIHAVQWLKLQTNMYMYMVCSNSVELPNVACVDERAEQARTAKHCSRRRRQQEWLGGDAWGFQPRCADRPCPSLTPAIEYSTIFLSSCFTAAQEYAESHGAVYIETSAKTAVNVPALFAEISKSPQHELTMMANVHCFLLLTFAIVCVYVTCRQTDSRTRRRF